MTDVSKLPKWARDKISRLEMHLREAEQARDELRNGCPGSPVSVMNFGMGGDQTLNPRANIRFVCGADEFGARDNIIEVRLQDGGLYVSGHGTLSVMPVAANVVTVHPVKWAPK